MKKLLAGSAAYFLPVVALAAAVNPTPLGDFLNGINDLINLIIPFLIGIAVLMVIIGIFRMVINAGDEEAREGGKQFVIWGIIGIVLMLAVWGLVALLSNIFGGLTDTGNVQDVIDNVGELPNL